MTEDSQDIALFDMDGTLCDYHGKLLGDLSLLAGPREKKKLSSQDLFDSDLPTYLRQRIRLIRRQPGWWKNLPFLKMGMDLYQLTQEMGYENVVVTKGPRSIPQAWGEKQAWVKRRLGDTKMVLADDKSLVYGKVLVEDYLPFIEPWLEQRPRGLVIIPDHSHNKGFSHPRAVRYTGKKDSFRRVKQALHIVKERKPGEDLILD